MSFVSAQTKEAMMRDWLLVGDSDDNLRFWCRTYLVGWTSNDIETIIIPAMKERVRLAQEGNTDSLLHLSEFDLMKLKSK